MLGDRRAPDSIHACGAGWGSFKEREAIPGWCCWEAGSGLVTGYLDDFYLGSGRIEVELSLVKSNSHHVSPGQEGVCSFLWSQSVLVSGLVQTWSQSGLV